ncbi:MAG: hypothetical protein JSU86_04080, partial [Phycisphaerales bacterium]
MIHFLFVFVLAVSGVTADRGVQLPAGNPPTGEQSQEKPAADQATVPADEEAEQQPKRTLDLSNPRAAMRAFLAAIQDAAGDHPERIDDAVKCLDTSQLEGEGEDRAKLARSLARRLHDIIDKRGVILDDISEEEEGTDYLY